ncbi:MAG: folylpolyglutamate synthase/dihydrofolate synthase family protein [Verrucomicrobiota bacterium]
MNYEQALQILGQIRLRGSKLGLDHVRALARRVGNPQNRLRFLHIAGTNGKGSVAAFLESALRAGGQRVGLYTSPHLISFGERIRVNFAPMEPEAIAAGVAELQPHLEALAAEDRAPTYFEVVVVLALLEFTRREVDWVVWETGLGGRLDATNLVTPQVCVLTRIGLDHTAWLGDTLAEIAAEKAGILKPGVPAVSVPQAPAAEGVIRERAAKVGAPLHVSTPAELRAMKSMPLGLRGPHQVVNAAAAAKALGLLKESGQLELADAPLSQGLHDARWPGRFDLVATYPPLVIDGAHNAEAMGATVAAWRAEFGALPRPLVVIGCLQDKPADVLLGLLLAIAEEFLIVGVKSGRAMPPAQLAGILRASGGGVVPSSRAETLAAAWPQIAEARRQGRPVLITGSLFLAGEALAIHEGRADELALNEHLGPPNP